MGNNKVMLIQTSASFRDKNEMIENIRDVLDKREEKVDLICFPELFSSNINLINLDNIAEKDDGETISFLKEVAKKKKAYIAGGFLEKDDDKYYNSAVLLDRNGNKILKHRKVVPNEFENSYLSSGDTVDVVETEFGKVGLIIGNDLNSLEVSNQLAKKEVDIIIYLTQVPYEYSCVIEEVAISRVMDMPIYMLITSNAGTSNISRINFKGITSILCNAFLNSDSILQDRNKYILNKIDSENVGVLYDTINIDKFKEEKEFSNKIIFHKEISERINKSEKGEKCNV